MSTGDPLLDRWLEAASWLFLVGVVMVIGSAVPALAQRFPRLLVQGFMVSIAAIGVALVASLTIG